MERWPEGELQADKDGRNRTMGSVAECVLWERSRCLQKMLSVTALPFVLLVH